MYFVKMFFFYTGIGWIRQFLKLKSKEHISLYANHLYLFSVYLCLQGSVFSKTFFKAFIAWRYTYSTVQLFCIKTNQYLSLMMAAWCELHQQWCCHNSVYLFKYCTEKFMWETNLSSSYHNPCDWLNIFARTSYQYVSLTSCVKEYCRCQ